MEGSGAWASVPGDQGINGEVSSNDWRSQLQPESRHRIVNKIMDTLRRHLPISAPEGLGELKKIAVRFEEKIYSAATNQSDYLRKISMKMLTMEQKTQGSVAANPLSLNPTITGQNSVDPSNLMQTQVRNHGQMAVPNQAQQRQRLPQNMQANIASDPIQGPGGLSPALSSLSGTSQSGISGIDPNPNLQTMPCISTNSVSNSAGQSVSTNMYANPPRQMQGRLNQQPMMPQQHQQPSQNQFLYQQKLLKQKLQQQSSVLQAQIPQQQQQQTLLQQNQLQSSQQPLISSGLQSNPNSLQHSQPSMIQSVSQSGMLKNQQNLVQQSASSLHQQHLQSLVRQQQSQPSNMHQQSSIMQQPTSITQQSALLPSQQQQLLNHQSNRSNIQHNQLIGQQNSSSDIQQQQQQQRLPSQQNSLLNMQQTQQMMNPQSISLHQQQQLLQQNNVSGLQQQQSQQPQTQILGSQPAVSNMQQHSMHALQHSKVGGQQASPALLQLQGQQPQAQSLQQQHMSQLQSQSHNMPQQMGMQQRLQPSGTLVQSQNAIEQQKQNFQPQRAIPEGPSTSVDSTAQTTQAGADWQEEFYQKIKIMKETYLTDLHELYQKIAMKLQQHESLVLPPRQSEQLEGMKRYKTLIEHFMQYLQMPKSSIRPGMKDKLPLHEKQIVNLLANRRRNATAQQQLQNPGAQTLPMSQPHSQVPHMLQSDNHTNQMQPMSLQAPTTTIQPNSISSNQSVTVPLSMQLTTQPNMTSPLQPSTNLEHGSALNSVQQGAVNSLKSAGLGSMHQNNMSGAHAMSQNNISSMQSSVSSLQSSSNMMQQQVKQEQQQQQHNIIQAQQMKRQMQQQMIQQQQQQQQQKHHLLQQQPQLQQQMLHQQKPQPSAQLQGHQLQQFHQMNESNELKTRQVSAMKPGFFQPHYPAGQRQTYYQQQLKLPPSFPISSPQNNQVPSPQISQSSSPQVDLSSLPKAGTSLQSGNASFMVPSPSTPLAPSPLPGDHEKQLSGTSSHAGNAAHQQTTHIPVQAPSLAVGTPGISASPLLADFSSMDGNQGNALATAPGKSTTIERPLERLIKAMRSASQQVVASSASDVGSVVSMIERIAGSAPGNGSRAAVGEDLVAMTKCRMQARSFMSQDGNAASKKMKRNTSAMPLNVVPSPGSVHESLKQLSVDTSELESTATSKIKRLKIEANHALLEEVRNINQQLIDTTVETIDEDVDSISSTSESKGTVVKCTYCALALSPSLKSQFASAKVSPILPLRLLVPANYPYSSPVLLDKISVEPSKESEDLLVKAKSHFSISLRGLSQPMSLKEMAKAWDVCARNVISEYAEQSGGGTFSSRYVTWENIVSA